MLSNAALLVAERTFEIREVPVPDRLPPGGALLQVEGCGICGSDVEQYNGAMVRNGHMRYPTIPGHEPLGRIAAIDEAGARRWGVKVGDRVAVHGIAPCGTCFKCMRGDSCSDFFHYGVQAFDVGSGLWGGFAQYMEIVPRAKLFPMSGELSVEDALLYNPLAAGFAWLVEAGGLRRGEVALVLGSGQRGLACVLAAAETGASRIIVTGLRRDEAKLELARKFGATDIVFAGEQDLPKLVREVTNGHGADVVVDTTPHAFAPILDAIEAVKMRGTIVLAGVKDDKPMPNFPIDPVIYRQIRLQGVLSTSQWATQQAIRLVESRRYPLHLLHTHRFPLNEVERAIQTLAGEIPGEAAIHISILPNG
jgi:threonine dehydrogenase-like Zn-dependent dehydrogenase